MTVDKFNEDTNLNLPAALKREVQNLLCEPTISIESRAKALAALQVWVEEHHERLTTQNHCVKIVAKLEAGIDLLEQGRTTMREGAALVQEAGSIYAEALGNQVRWDRAIKKNEMSEAFKVLVDAIEDLIKLKGRFDEQMPSAVDCLAATGRSMDVEEEEEPF